MKKYLSILVLSCIMFTLVACGNKKEKQQSTTTYTETTSVEDESIVDAEEEETIIGPGGTVLNVKKAKDALGQDIYVEEITNEAGNKTYKQVVTKDDGTVSFVDVEPNDQGEYVTKSEHNSGNRGDGETKDADSDWVEGTDDYNNGSGWSDIY